VAFPRNVAALPIPQADPTLSRKEKGESKMSKLGKYFLLAAGVALLVTFVHIPGASIKVHAHDRGCSVASLKGRYAFHRMGTNNLVGGPSCQGLTDCGPIAEIGIAYYGGDGTRGMIRNTRSTAGEIRPWGDYPAPQGTYTVDPDCTGSYFDADGNQSNNVVVVDGGKRFFVLSVAPGTTVMEEGVRLEDDRE
jgi:hypothetical protein